VKNDGRPKNPPPPLDETRLRNLALHYVGKYATTRAKLAAYLNRKIRERGWGADRPADLDALVEQFADLGYVNDAQFAESRSRSFVARGYGKRRLDEDLRAAGISDSDAAGASGLMNESMFTAALNYARRKRIGPFASEIASLEQQHRQLQGFLRAGHGFDLARRFVRAEPGAELNDE
jgi:regulatory protein